MKPTTCKFYNGSQNKCCKAGVEYDSVTTDPKTLLGKGLRIPCFTVPGFSTPSQLEHFNRRGTCEKLQLPTKEELEEDEREVEALVTRMKKLSPLISRIKKEKKGQSWQGVEVCPVCKGVLHLRISGYNGHVHGQCETKDCVAWME